MRGAMKIVLLGALLACAHAPPAPAPTLGPPAAKLFPLAVGNRWTYRVQFLGANQLLSVAIVSGQPGTFVDNRGQRYYVDHAGVRDDRRYLLRDPLSPGKSWNSVVSLTETEAYQVAGIGESIEVPAGHFSGCVRVEGRNPGPGNAVQLAEQVYCPDVGLVRVTTYEEIGGRRSPPQWREELVAYRLGG
jgi:hypothetical protein